MRMVQSVLPVALVLIVVITCFASDAPNVSENQKLRFIVQPDSTGLRLSPVPTNSDASDVMGVVVTCEAVQVQGPQTVFINATCASDGDSFITGTRLTISSDKKSLKSLLIDCSDDTAIEFDSAEAKNSFLRLHE